MEQQQECLEQANSPQKKGKSPKNKPIKHELDAEFVRREQTEGRNLTSNTLKLYLR